MSAGPHRPARATARTAGLLTLAVLAVSALTILSASADAYLYWANGGMDTIGRANLDGTGVNQSFITGAGNPGGVAVDADHVYWANGGSGHDRPRQPRRHAASTRASSPAPTPAGVAVDAGHVYWANAGTGTIGRANLDGTGVEPELHHRRQLPRRGRGRRRPHLLGERQHGHDRPRQPRRHGRRPELHHRRRRLPCGRRGRRRPRLLGEPRPDTIGRANLDGTRRRPELHHAAPSVPCGVAVDASHVYWTNCSTRHDRPRQPRRHGRRPELHHRRQRPLRRGGRRAETPQHEDRISCRPPSQAQG